MRKIIYNKSSTGAWHIDDGKRFALCRSYGNDKPIKLYGTQTDNKPNGVRICKECMRVINFI